jgi:hypothetical protein
METLRDFSEELADNMQGVFLLTPNEIEQIVGTRAFKSFEKGILEPLSQSVQDEDEYQTESYYEFIDVFKRQFFSLDSDRKEFFIKSSLERSKTYVLKNAFIEGIAELAVEIGNSDLSYARSVDKIDSFCKKSRSREKKKIENSLVQEALKQDLDTLISDSKYLEKIMKDYLF